jgi:glucuronokinase
MDFSRHFMEQWGHGLYEVMDKNLLPPLFLAYVNKPSFSGRIHSNLRARYEAGDPIVLRAIEEWRELTDEAKEALEQRDYKRLAQLMNRNFNLRREVLGDAALGQENLEMIEIGRKLGAPTKLPGSGGAVIGIFWDEEHFRKLQRAYNEKGYACVKVEV